MAFAVHQALHPIAWPSCWGGVATRSTTGLQPLRGWQLGYALFHALRVDDVTVGLLWGVPLPCVGPGFAHYGMDVAGHTWRSHNAQLISSA